MAAGRNSWRVASPLIDPRERKISHSRSTSSVLIPILLIAVLIIAIWEIMI
jgi:hypothetical protein